MIKGRLIVCIASSWEYDPTSKHHIMRILSRHNDVLWVNYHGSRRPTASRVDLADSLRALRRVARGLVRVNRSFTHVTPFVIPGATHPLLKRWHERLLIVQLRRAIRRMRRTPDQPVQIWSFAPDVPFLFDAVPAERLIYYCVDDFTQFDGYDAARIAAAEAQTIDRADVLIVTSDALLETKGCGRPDTRLVRHGVDFDHFAAAWRSQLPLPPDLAVIPRPIFGYFGVIHHWVDLALLADVARRRPLYSFVLLGENKVDTSVLNGVENVFLLGQKPYAELPAYAAGFDAALMLFKRNGMTRHVNPIKLHEYLAAGLRVVSTDLPEVRRHEGAVLLADGPSNFAVACDRAIGEVETSPRERISRLVEDEDWRLKVERLSHIVSSAGSRTAAAAAALRKTAFEVAPMARREITVGV